jgi:hypothetical protein
MSVYPLEAVAIDGAEDNPGFACRQASALVETLAHLFFTLMIAQN